MLNQLLILSFTIQIGFFVFISNKLDINKPISLLSHILAIILYVYVIAYITILSRWTISDRASQLIPFQSYFMLLSHKWIGWGMYDLMAIVGNVMMFIPLGMLITSISKNRLKHIPVCIIAFFTSLAIELSQYYTKLGTFETDDLINNTLGALFGCCIALALTCEKRTPQNIIKRLYPVCAYMMILFICITCSVLV